MNELLTTDECFRSISLINIPFFVYKKISLLRRWCENMVYGWSSFEYLEWKYTVEALLIMEFGEVLLVWAKHWTLRKKLCLLWPHHPNDSQNWRIFKVMRFCFQHPLIGDIIIFAGSLILLLDIQTYPYKNYTKEPVAWKHRQLLAHVLRVATQAVEYTTHSEMLAVFFFFYVFVLATFWGNGFHVTSCSSN